MDKMEISCAIISPLHGLHIQAQGIQDQKSSFAISIPSKVGCKALYLCQLSITININRQKESFPLIYVA